MNLNNNIESRKKYFYDNINLKEEDKERAIKYLKSKGVESHIAIMELLKPYYDNGKIDYELIASTYRYDKRIRNTLFKYLAYLEEYYRGLILDKYNSNFDKLKCINALKSKYEEHGDLRIALEEILFSELKNQIVKIKEEYEDVYIFPSIKYMDSNLNALVELRNAVMHNKLLILRRNFKECYPDFEKNSKSATLSDNIRNLINYLPPHIREKCANDINDCAIREGDDEHTKWVLPDIVKIEIDANIYKN